MQRSYSILDQFHKVWSPLVTKTRRHCKRKGFQVEKVTILFNCKTVNILFLYSFVIRRVRVLFGTDPSLSPCTTARTCPATMSVWSSVRKKETMMSWVSEMISTVVSWCLERLLHNHKGIASVPTVISVT